MPTASLALLVVLLGVSLALLFLIVALLRRPSPALRFDALEKANERAERALREELGRNREAAGHAERDLRAEVAASLRTLGEAVQAQLRENGGVQLDQLTLFSDRLERLSLGLDQKLGELREGVDARIERLITRNEEKLEALRGIVDERLRQLQDDNGKQLEQMRATVDEKLQGTLERRLGESFKQVSDRLEQVHKGLGEMQTLAVGVGDLKRVLTNVKSRGGWGEVQLGALLEQMLTPEQYERNVKPRDGSDEMVEFALVLPGRSGIEGERIYMPIDAKFPTEDYQRLVQAQEAADPVAAEEAAQKLALRIKACAKEISGKYVCPPRTTDFAILFLPTEGLYAEVARQGDLMESVQREHRVTIAGPSILAALLNALQMGFRTLAVQQRSSEVWTLLGAVKSEFGKFGDVLDSVRKKLDQASTTIELAGRRSRAIERKLRDVEEVPSGEAPFVLEGGPGEIEPEVGIAASEPS